MRPFIQLKDEYNVVHRRGAWQAQRLFRVENVDTWALIALELDPRTSNSDAIVSMVSLLSE